MKPAIRQLLSLHALSTAAQTAYDVAAEHGDLDTAASLRAMGIEVARLIGALVVAESRRNRPSEATS